MANVRRLGILISLLLASMILLVGCGRSQAEKKPVDVVFRYDDYSSLSSTDTARMVIDVFRSNGAALTFAVIPFVSTNVHDPGRGKLLPLNAAKVELLQAAIRDGTVDIAQHGYSHQRRDVKEITEFAGLDYASQLERIAKGKQFLEAAFNVPIVTFVPPWDSYDAKTLRALAELGFSTISSGEPDEEHEKSALHSIPASTTLSGVRQAVEKARTAPDARPFIVVLFHEYDFADAEQNRGGYTEREFSDLVGRLQSQKDVRLLTIAQAARMIEDPGASQFRSGNSISSALKLLPFSFTKRLRASCLRSTLSLWLCVGVWYLAPAVMIALAAFAALRLLFAMKARSSGVTPSPPRT